MTFDEALRSLCTRPRPADGVERTGDDSGLAEFVRPQLEFQDDIERSEVAQIAIRGLIESLTVKCLDLGSDLDDLLFNIATNALTIGVAIGVRMERSVDSGVDSGIKRSKVE